MVLEYEYRYINYDKKEIISTIKSNGGSKKGIYLFRVSVFTHPNEKSLYIRVRDEGFRITMTIKEHTLEFAEENEIIINSYDTGVTMLLALGCKKKYSYEKIREIWDLGKCEIVFDTSPGKMDIMEIECTKLSDLKKYIKLLGLNGVSHDDFDNLNGTYLYKSMFGIEFKEKVDITFKQIDSVLKPLVTKNKKQFNELIKLQKALYKKLI